MSERRPLGDILQELGRVTQADVDRALEHQRGHGGYFGQALVALGILKQGEVDWSLASQFDLPYVFPDADSVDPEAASLVSGDWALSHVALPIARIGDRVTLVVDSPLSTAAAEELARKAGVEVELALASTDAIREVIREVYSRERRRREGLTGGEILSIAALRRHVETAGADRWGISVREDRAIGWFEQGGVPRRYRLRAGWDAELNESLSPPPTERLPRRGEAAWTARFAGDPESALVEIRGLASDDGQELLVTRRDSPPGYRLLTSIPAALLDELRVLLDGKVVRIAVRSEPPELGQEVLPHLPGLLLPTGHRSIHLSATRRAIGVQGVLALSLEGPAGSDERRLHDLAEFHFDAVTAELDRDRMEIWPVLRELAPSIFLLLSSSNGGEAAPPPGIDWLLEVAGAIDRPWTWTLHPVSY